MEAEIIWAIAGIILFFIEFFIPGLVIIFFGIGALVTSIVTFILGDIFSLPYQILLFTITSVLSLMLLRKYMKKVFKGKSLAGFDGENFNIEIGQIVPVIELIEPGEVGGKVKYQGTQWNARSDESIAPGESVEITGIKNLTLIVSKIKKEEK